MSPAPGLRIAREDDGAVAHAVLASPPANVLDAITIGGLTALFREAAEDRDLKAILIEADGPHFSYGASVAEHLPGAYPAMLAQFHGLFHAMLASSVPTLAAVRGRCLGGALELTSFCHRVFVAPDAQLGQPEIVLGVFAPVASVFLTERVGRSRAEDLCLTGRSLGAAEALSIGLVDEVVPDPAHAALDYARKYLAPRSASSLRLATRAVRAGLAARFAAELSQVERLYTNELMSTKDAVEGLTAFLEKRPPRWRNA